MPRYIYLVVLMDERSDDSVAIVACEDEDVARSIAEKMGNAGEVESVLLVDGGGVE